MTAPTITRAQKTWLTVYMPVTLREQLGAMAAARSCGPTQLARTLIAEAVQAHTDAETPPSDA